MLIMIPFSFFVCILSLLFYLFIYFFILINLPRVQLISKNIELNDLWICNEKKYVPKTMPTCHEIHIIFEKRLF